MKEPTAYPGFFRRRAMLDTETTPADTLRAQGAELLAQGMLDEALTFLARAGDGEGVEKVMEESRRTGDTFAFEAALRVRGGEVSREEWGALGREALRRGMFWFAYRAFEKADDQEGLKEVRAAMEREGITLPG